MRQSIGRRTFLKAAAGGAGLVILKNSASVWSAQANEKLNIALVGVGGRGDWFVGALPGLGQNLVAMCDVNERRAGEGFAKFPQAKKYKDFRKMLEEMHSDIDAVIVATPDNTHAVVSAMAIQMGKHVYTEKPLTLTIREARTLRELARKHKVATSMGNQGTASESFRRAIELVRAGVLGDVREVHAWNSAGGPGPRPAPTETPICPEYIDWDLWLGPAAERPYNPRWMAGWHGWRDFGTGTAGNWGCHSMNAAFKALRLDELWLGDADKPHPVVTVQGRTSGTHETTYPKWESIGYDFPARGDMPPVRLNWYNGSECPEGRALIEKLQGGRLDWGDAGEKRWKDHGGCLIVGSKAMLRLTEHNSSSWLLPVERFKDFVGPARTLPRSPGHERDWLAACRGGEPAMASFDYADALTEMVLLSNVATRFEGKIEFDPVACKVTNNPGADQALSRQYRKGWTL